MIGETVAPSQALWDAVNAYAAACGGDTGDGTIGGARMDAVAAIERAAAGLVQERLEEAARVTLADLATPSDETVRKLLAREAARLVPADLRAEVLGALRLGAEALREAAESEVVVEQNPRFEHGPVDCVADCAACEYEEDVDPRPSWEDAASDLLVLADRLEAVPVPGSPLVVEAVRLALAAPCGRGAEQRDVVDLVASVLSELFNLRGRERRHLEILGQSAGYILSAADAIEEESGDIDGECWEARVFADHVLEHVAKTKGEPYTRPDRGPNPALGGDNGDD